MTLFLLICLTAVPLLMIFWGVSGKDRMLQLPTLAGVAILVLVVPQMVGIYKGMADLLSPEIINSHGFELTLVVHTLFYAAFAVGYIYAKAKPLPFQDDLNNPAVLNALFWFGSGMLAISLFANWKLSQFCGGGFLAFYRLDTGAYTLDWHGWPVVYVNFVRLVYAGLFCLLFVALKRPSIIVWLLVALALIHPILSVVILGRRTAVMTLALTILIPLFFAKKWHLPRWSIIVMVLGGGITFYSFAQYRSQDIFNQSYATSAEALSLKPVAEAMGGDEKKTIEMAASVTVISSAGKNYDFGWGRCMWQSSVQLLVPKMIFSPEFKNWLLTLWESNLWINRVYGGKEYYIAVSGPAGAFAEFWYGGALVFYFLGAIGRHIWNRATKGSVVYMLLYAATTPKIILIMFNDMSQLFGYLVMVLVPMIPLLWWVSSNTQMIPRRKQGR